jgi:hypothetical protein
MTWRQSVRLVPLHPLAVLLTKSKTKEIFISFYQKGTYNYESCRNKNRELSVNIGIRVRRRRMRKELGDAKNRLGVLR